MRRVNRTKRSLQQKQERSFVGWARGCGVEGDEKFVKVLRRLDGDLINGNDESMFGAMQGSWGYLSLICLLCGCGGVPAVWLIHARPKPYNEQVRYLFRL